MSKNCLLMLRTLFGSWLFYFMSSLALSFNYSFAGSLRSCGDLLKNTKINTLYIKNIRFLKKSVADASFRGGFLNLSSDNYFYLEYTHFKKSFMFYVTLVLLFILVGILDIFSYSNSALSLMVYLLFIVLILLLVLYTPASVADKLNELEHHLITFSSLKNKSAAAASSLLNVSAGLKANLNLTFFIVWKLFFEHTFIFNFIKNFDELEDFFWNDTDFDLNTFIYWQSDLYRF